MLALPHGEGAGPPLRPLELPVLPPGPEGRLRPKVPRLGRGKTTPKLGSGPKCMGQPHKSRKNIRLGDVPRFGESLRIDGVPHASKGAPQVEREPHVSGAAP